MFISIDGIDGAGKTTQLDRLQQWLGEQGRDVEFVRDPGTTPAGEAIRGLLLDSDLEMHGRCEALLYMAARSQLVEQRIIPALDRGAVVVSDRYLLANVVYQSVLGDVEPDLIWRLGEIATAGVYPDLTIVLDLSAEEAARRRTGPEDRMEKRGTEYLESVRRMFQEQIGHLPGTALTIDASGEIDAVWAKIKSAVAGVLNR